MAFKLSPSKLTFLYDECDRCFWLDAHGTWKRPYMPFPSIFSSIDRVMRAAYAGESSRFIDPDMPAGIIDTKGKRLKSAPVKVGNSELMFSGALDALLNFDDGAIGIIDFKTSQPKPQNVELYRRQLMAYAHIYQTPVKGAPQNTTHMGLVCVTPETFHLKDRESASMTMKPTYQPIAVDWDWWDSFCLEVITLLEGDEPDGKPDCPFCAMHRALNYEKNATQTQQGTEAGETAQPEISA